MPASQGRSTAGDVEIGQAPDGLATLQAFVNTLDIEQGTDALATPADLASWLREAGLAADPGEQAGPRDLALAIDLREALRGVLRSHVTHKAARSPAARAVARAETARPAGRRGPSGAGASVTRPSGADQPRTDQPGADQPGADQSGADQSGASAVRTLAEVTAAMRAGIHAEPDGRVVVVPAGSGTRAALTRLLLIAAEAGTAGTWPRLKVCSADDCQWAFYDRSPTRSGCWCSMQICGSRAKSRAYRNRASSRRWPTN
jgi:predicted RNA-binding Zn ribbon-like protein